MNSLVQADCNLVPENAFIQISILIHSELQVNPRYLRVNHWLYSTVFNLAENHIIFCVLTHKLKRIRMGACPPVQIFLVYSYNFLPVEVAHVDIYKRKSLAKYIPPVIYLAISTARIQICLKNSLRSLLVNYF